MRNTQKNKFELMTNNINELFKMITRITLSLNGLSKNLSNCVEQMFINKKEINYLKFQIKDLKIQLENQKKQGYKKGKNYSKKHINNNRNKSKDVVNANKTNDENKKGGNINCNE